MKNEINLCLLADDNYIMQTIVTINSIYLNKNSNTSYKIYIILNSCSKENINMIKKLNKKNFEINIVNIDKLNDLLKFNISEISASPTAICKFYIPKILSDIDKVLYIDSDIIVKDDLIDLYNININNYYVGAVKDTCGLSRSLYKLFKKDVFYFNSGVMLMNLKKMRKDNISDKLIEYRVSGYNQLMDQDAFNFILKRKVKELPFIYNTQLCFFEDIKRFDSNMKLKVIQDYFNLSNNNSDFNEIINNAKILHYSGSLKPWNDASVIESDLWVYYYYNSLLKDNILYKKRKLKKKVGILNKIIKRLRRYKFMHNFIRKGE